MMPSVLASMMDSIDILAHVRDSISLVSPWLISGIPDIQIPDIHGDTNEAGRDVKQAR
jgi:hypothetical protein